MTNADLAIRHNITEDDLDLLLVSIGSVEIVACLASLADYGLTYPVLLTLGKCPDSIMGLAWRQYIEAMDPLISGRLESALAPS